MSYEFDKALDVLNFIFTGVFALEFMLKATAFNLKVPNY